MPKSILAVTLSLVLVVPAFADEPFALSPGEDDFDHAFAELHGSPSPEAEQSLEGVEALRKESGRYNRAIRAIHREAEKPSWGWDGDCDEPRLSTTLIPAI